MDENLQFEDVKRAFAPILEQRQTYFAKRLKWCYSCAMQFIRLGQLHC